MKKTIYILSTCILFEKKKKQDIKTIVKTVQISYTNHAVE